MKQGTANTITILKITTMIISKNEINVKRWSKNLILLILLSFLGSISIVLNAQSNTDSTSITYYRLNEVAKFVEFKKQADSLLLQNKAEIKSLELIVIEQNKKITEFNTVTIPNFQNRISLLQKDAQNYIEIIALKDDVFKEERKRLRQGKLQWGIVGLSLGAIAVLVIVN